MTFLVETAPDRAPDHAASMQPLRSPDAVAVLRPPYGRSRITNGKHFDPRKVRPGSSMARRYADIQAELLKAAGPDISPQLKMMVPHIAVLKMTIGEQENLLAAREPGFNADAYGVMVDRLYLTVSCDDAFVSLASNRTFGLTIMQSAICSRGGSIPAVEAPILVQRLEATRLQILDVYGAHCAPHLKRLCLLPTFNGFF